jgi:hypothetical protein
MEDAGRYNTAVQVPDEVFHRLKITLHRFHGDCSYTPNGTELQTTPRGSRLSGSSPMGNLLL